jgi:hypothetical protein
MLKEKKMKTSESIEHIATAYALAQAELQNPPKNKVNPHFKSSYVDLADGLDTIRKVFAKHHLAFIQGTSVSDGIIVMNTRIMHKSGQWIESEYPVSGFSKPQEMGSAMTYARRYSLFAMVGVAGEDDDDGNAAQAATEASSPATVKKGPGRPAKQMEPGLSPDDSAKALKAFTFALEMAQSEAELVAWAADNKDEIAKLLPSHRNDLLGKYTAHKKSLAGAVDA